MKTITITSIGIKDIFTQLEKQLKGTYTTNLREHVIDVDNELCFGTVRGMKLKGGISFLEFDVTFSENVNIQIQSPLQSVVNFAYCAEGTIAHAFGNSSKKQLLESFQTGILSNINTANNNLYFAKNEQVTTTLITVNCMADSANNPLHVKLYNTFIENKQEDYIYIGSYNLKIADKINQLNAIKEDGVVRTLLIEGLVHIILALEIEQHKKDATKVKENTGSLTTKEMSSIKELSQYIVNYPETEFTVTDFCSKVGLTPAKLQEGFKLMHNRTVNDFIRDERVKKAEELIKTTDLNISQIVYSIGFSSRSYFSKIFKEKYNFSPSEYKSKIKLAVSA